MKLTREEQETGIDILAADKTALISTTDPVMIRRMDKLAAKHPGAYTLVREDAVSKTYRCSDKRLCFPRAPRAVREMTDAQRAAVAERLRKAKEAQTHEE